MGAESAHVHEGSHGRIRGIEHLESSVEPESVHNVGAYPTAYVIIGFEYLYAIPRLLQLPGRGESRQTGADHNDIGFREMQAHGSRTLRYMASCVSGCGS